MALARTQRFVKKVVFMGMGEPAHNLDNVPQAIHVLGTVGQIGHKNLVFSTVGDPRVFERLPPGEVKPGLALSLHTTKPELRRQLLPRAPQISPEELVELAEAYARATGFPVLYQWTLLEGVNDGEDELDVIVRLLKGRYALLNMIPYNTIPELESKRPSWERAAANARNGRRRRANSDAAPSTGDLEATVGPQHCSLNTAIACTS